MGYTVECIGDQRSHELRDLCRGKRLYNAKADINGICVQLLTEDREIVRMWNDNFYHMSDKVRAHAMLYCISDESCPMHVEYDIESSILFLFNFDYYGWIKSIALGVAGNILEDAHGIHPVHGAVLDVDGEGVTLIAPSKTGKTTQSWGLLRLPNTRLISDDWYFVSFGRGAPMVSGSEKNCYIDADIGDVWSEYRELVEQVRFDNRGRGIGNVRWVAGSDAMAEHTSVKHIILLKRDPSDQAVERELGAEEALAYLEANDFCNPHQLVRNQNRVDRRRDFFRRYLSECTVHMVNTIRPAEETQAIIRKAIGRGENEERFR
jgi:hypothetical protein